MSTPIQKPHRSKQNYRTPREFFAAVAHTFGRMQVELAAEDDELCPVWLGPGSSICTDTFCVDWAALLREHNTNGWLNPPFEYLRPWAAKCAREAARGAHVAMLSPASFGDWYCQEVQGKALTLVLRPRIVFVGETHAYPKDLALHLWGFGLVGIATWRWKEPTRTRRKNARGPKGTGKGK
jgi:hypothetical protein